MVPTALTPGPCSCPHRLNYTLILENLKLNNQQMHLNIRNFPDELHLSLIQKAASTGYDFRELVIEAVQNSLRPSRTGGRAGHMPPMRTKWPVDIVRGKCPVLSLWFRVRSARKEGHEKPF